MFNFSTDASSEFFLEANLWCNNQIDPTPISISIGDLHMPFSSTERVHGRDPEHEPYLLQNSGHQVFSWRRTGWQHSYNALQDSKISQVSYNLE